MPKPVPPARLSLPATPEPFRFSDDGCRAIAVTLGLSGLPPLMAAFLECNIGNYKTNTRHGVKATLGENIAAIDEALNAADAIGKALMPFTRLESSGIGQGTYRALAPFAATLLEHLHTFRHKAKARREELVESPALPKNPQLGQLCLLLRAIYEAVEEARNASTNEKELRKFALSVMEAARIPRENYHDHPSRLTELFYFNTVPSSELRRYVNTELRKEIEELIRGTRRIAN
jgi:hypothetical protein